MNTEVLQLLLYSLIGSVLALIGGLIFLYSKKLSDSLAKNSIPFAAGVLITVSLIGLLPEASHLIGDQAFLWVLGSFLIMYLFEHLVFGLHHHTHDCKHEHGHDSVHHHATVPMVLVGDTIHNFIDGIAIGVTFLVSPGLGLATAISTLLHEIPHEIGDFGILLQNGWKKINIIIVNLISGSFTIFGAFLVYYYPVSDNILGILMAISAGIFLYLGATDFLPQIDVIRENKQKALIPLLFGVAVMYATLIAVPHDHDIESNDHDHADETADEHSDEEMHFDENDHIEDEFHDEEILLN